MAKLTDRETELKEAKATLEHLDGLSVEFEGKGSDLAGWLAEVQEIVAGPGEDDRPGQPSEEPAGAQASAHDPDRGHARRRRHLVVRLHGRLGRMPAELIDACYPPAVAERLYSAKNKEFSSTVSRRALMVCPRGDSNTRHAV